MIIFRFFKNFLFFLLILLSWLYIFITFIIRNLYKYKLFRVYRFPLSIIVIGNLTMGGSGKTPVVLWLAKKLKNHGWKVGIVSRGYGGKSKSYPIIINNNTNIYECGDEVFLLWKRTNMPIAISPKRADAVKILLKKQPLDIIISDDGLQHYSLARNIEWVIIDGEYRFGNGYRLPAGPMREGINRLHKVQKIIVNGGYPAPNEIPMYLKVEIAVNMVNGNHRKLKYFHSVVAMAGICYPYKFFNILRINKIKIIREFSFQDHQYYNKKLISNIIENNEVLFMTEKDAVKCFNFADINWWYIPVDAFFSENCTKNLINSVEDNILSNK